MDDLFVEFETPRSRSQQERGWPAINLYDHGESLIIYAAVPGLKDDEINISAQEDVVTLSGSKVTETPDGYTVHRKERSTVNFSRSFSLPIKVDFDKSVANLKNGILTVMLPKSPEAQPRRIAVTTN